MKAFHLSPALLGVTLLIGACSSMPTTTSLLEQTRSDFLAAQSNPDVARYASLELTQARDALGLANDAASRNDSTEAINLQAYMAKQKIALTQEVAKQKAAEADVTNAGKQRDQMRLDQRTIEADQANLSAAQARAAAQQAQDATSAAQGQALAAQSRNAQLEAQLAELAAKKTERGMVITFGDMLFGTDLARLNAEGMRTAQKVALVLQQNPSRSVLVEGFADSTGTAMHNQALSERRAAAVWGALQEMGVSSNRVIVRGYGESHPVAGNDTPENRQLNRRVEIVLSDENGKVSQR
ncbi:OmpA family protein [Chitinimonas viridis]|uniref:OmpA family protein n=1 Tax=Chitinimonas viridis TaxID=664880 RepID=A0ABT8B0A2_9NEIS|nr:OmpA family protein [Chitinimonas viridis]MDN3575479.1 OmpA family protein [Chitinimonas viridis]